jgi:glutamine synthetase
MSRRSVFLEYIWLDSVCATRSKTRVIQVESVLVSLSDIPIWNYDGSSTGQAETSTSEIIIKPIAMYNDPFMQQSIPNAEAYLVLCDTYVASGDNLVPHSTNTRVMANAIFSRYEDQKPWYGIEQEFFIMNTKTGRPLGFPERSTEFPTAQGQYYCSAGEESAFGRDLVVKAFGYCIAAGLTVSGMNAEVAPGQWEIQIGPCIGIAAADQMYIMRYILKRTSESFPGLSISFHSKPVQSLDWNGSGAHTNFSTEHMRLPEGNGHTGSSGYKVIMDAVLKLKHKHIEHLAVYGNDNHLRLTGKCETSDMKTFSAGVGSRSASIRIPTQTAKDGYGYLEDRRPSSSCDPYLVTAMLLKTIME